MNKLKISNMSIEIQVDHNQNVLKLPNGINLVTMMRPGHGQSIQVKLPLTGKWPFKYYVSMYLAFLGPPIHLRQHK